MHNNSSMLPNYFFGFTRKIRMLSPQDVNGDYFGHPMKQRTNVLIVQDHHQNQRIVHSFSINFYETTTLHNT